MPIDAPFGGILGNISPKWYHSSSLPQKTVTALNHVIWAMKREYWPRRSSWALEREKRQNRRRQEKSHKKGYISRIWGEASTKAIYIKNCLAGDVLDIITCTKFQNEIFSGYDFTGGRIFHFHIDFWVGLTTVRRYCAACDTLNSWHFNCAGFSSRSISWRSISACLKITHPFV